MPDPFRATRGLRVPQNTFSKTDRYVDKPLGIIVGIYVSICVGKCCFKYYQTLRLCLQGFILQWLSSPAVSYSELLYEWIFHQSQCYMLHMHTEILVHPGMMLHIFNLSYINVHVCTLTAVSLRLHASLLLSHELLQYLMKNNIRVNYAEKLLVFEVWLEMT